MKKILLTILFILFYSTIVQGRTLSWQPSPSDDVAGYKVYYGFSSRNYDFVIDVGNIYSYPMPFKAGIIYFMTVTAYDTSNNESVYPDKEPTYLKVSYFELGS